jgi:hypothetical protein
LTSLRDAEDASQLRSVSDCDGRRPDCHSKGIRQTYFAKVKNSVLWQVLIYAHMQVGQELRSRLVHVVQRQKCMGGGRNSKAWAQSTKSHKTSQHSRRFRQVRILDGVEASDLSRRDDMESGNICNGTRGVSPIMVQKGKTEVALGGGATLFTSPLTGTACSNST